jgi:hypothetical protein
MLQIGLCMASRFIPMDWHNKQQQKLRHLCRRILPRREVKKCQRADSANIFIETQTHFFQSYSSLKVLPNIRLPSPGSAAYKPDRLVLTRRSAGWSMDCPVTHPVHRGLARSMRMLQAFFDDADSFKDSGSLCLAGYVSDQYAWTALSQEWASLLGKHQMAYLHTSDFLSGHPPYAAVTLEDEDRVKIVREFVQVINRHVLFGVSVASTPRHIKSSRPANAKRPPGTVLLLQTAARGHRTNRPPRSRQASLHKFSVIPLNIPRSFGVRFVISKSGSALLEMPLRASHLRTMQWCFLSRRRNSWPPLRFMKCVKAVGHGSTAHSATHYGAMILTAIPATGNTGTERKSLNTFLRSRQPPPTINPHFSPVLRK